MNNEIKKILYFKENADYKKLSCDEIKVLRDYITNLQHTKELYNQLLKDYDELQQENEHLSKSYYNLHEKYYKQKQKLENKNIILKGIREERNYLYNKLSIEKKELLKKSYKDDVIITKAIEYGQNCLENLKDQENYMCESIDIVELLKMIHKNYINILEGREDE